MVTATVALAVKRLPHAGDLPSPAYATAGAAGFDLAAALGPGEDLILPPLGRALVPTGLAAAVPAGYELQIRPRSGLAVRHGVTVLNSPGTVDSDYRGEIKVALVNLGAEPFVVRRGERIAQAVLARVAEARIDVVLTLDDTVRGAGGFGSTGR